MNLIVAVAIVLLNLYVTACISYQIHSFVLSVHIPDVSTSICVEVDSITQVSDLDFEVEFIA